LLVVFATAAVVGTAWATTRRAGGPWPGSRITVFDASGWTRTVRAAIRRWNAVGAKVRLVEVRRRRGAEVTIVGRSPAAIRRDCPADGRGHGCLAYATIGYRRRGAQVVLPTARAAEDRAPSLTDQRMVTHELGHVLGLRHRHGCTVMAPDVTRIGCRGRAASAPGPYAADAQAIDRLYGQGHVTRGGPLRSAAGLRSPAH
jgi:predicted Zn-dependent protease